jgi:four helix bundle protein
MEKSGKYDLEERTLKFAESVREFIKKLPRTLSNLEDSKQLIRSSGSIGANYIEANEALSKKDFNHRIKISRKEAKESVYWLKLLSVETDNLKKDREMFVNEATELLKIFSAIMRKSV